MLRLVIKGSALAATLGIASLVFADALVVTALVLVTVGVTAVALVIGPQAEPEGTEGGADTA